MSTTRRTTVQTWADADALIARNPKSLHNRLMAPVVREALARQIPVATLAREAGVCRIALVHFTMGQGDLSLDTIEKLHKWADVKLVCQ